MRVFIDSSSLAKRYLKETGSGRVDEILSLSDEIIVCSIAFPEVLCALNRALRNALLSHEEYEESKEFLKEDFLDMTIVPVDIDIALKTEPVLESSVIRAMDSLHVTSAVESEVDLFLSSDPRQLEAAGIAGLKVERV